MRWEGDRQSENVEDRRSFAPGPIAISGGLGTIILVVVVALLGGDPMALLQQAPPPGGGGPPAAAPAPAGADKDREFVAVVLADTEDVWNELFRRMGRRYDPPKLVLFTSQVRSACGLADAAVGPFYCPNDQKVYIDLRFFQELSERFGAPGDFARAYVIAHEVGHHVQNLLGTMNEVQRTRERSDRTEANRLSVRLELQADFYAGVWAHHAQKMKNILEAGDIDDGLRAASAVGDDRLQRQARGYVVPDSFTHGSSAQRVYWFKKGLRSGDLREGDTFQGN